MMSRLAFANLSTPRRCSLEPIVELWALRFLEKLELHRQFISSLGWSSDLVSEALALSDPRQPGMVAEPSIEADDMDEPSGDFDMRAARTLLQARLTEAEANPAAAHPPTVVAQNMAQLQALVDLTDIEARILTFAVFLHTERVLDKLSDWLGEMTSAGLYHALSVLIDIEEPAVRRALSAQGALAGSGLLSVDRSQRWALTTKLDLLSEAFADQILSDRIAEVDLLRGLVTIASPPTLTLEDYSHVEEQVGLIRAWLERASRARRHGVNVLVHGAPGTGKTELTRVLARELQLSLYEVTGENADGDAVPGGQRLRAFRASQAFFAERRALMVLDEAEDVFARGHAGERSVAQSHKAWLNRALEQNPVPTFWLTNTVGGMDPAFVRRFDLVLHLPVPPERSRARIISRACENRVPDACLRRLSAHPALAPGVVARAADVLQHVADDWTPQGFGDALERMVNDTLEAQGHAALAPHDVTSLTGGFDSRLVNVAVDLAVLARNVAKAPSARLCLYGPPGTGKTAFATWLARELGSPLMLRRASDMVSPYIGETEQNIARVFCDATREGALLLIDEADSFLRERAGSQHNWEVSAVNEMLTQIEYFDGVLVMATNLFDSLDAAALRRFDAKLHFGYMKPGQAVRFFAQRCEALCFATPNAVAEQLVSRLSTLTLGDFAAVIRRHRFLPLASAIDFAEALANECARRQRASAPIGFVR